MGAAVVLSRRNRTGEHLMAVRAIGDRRYVGLLSAYATPTIAFCAQAAGDVELAATQRDAYREFRGYVARLIGECKLAKGPGAENLAERLIAAADGIAVEALFDPERWSPMHQLATLHASVAPLLAMASQ